MTSTAMTNSGISPLERIHRFIDELRARGVPVSMVERLDAMRAADIAELDQADGLRTALRCTLIKSPDHLSVFEEVYDLYFSPASHRPATPAGQPDAARPPLDLERAVIAVLRDGSEELARQVAEQAIGEFVQFEAGRPVAGVMYERATLAGLRLEELAARQLTEAAAGLRGPGTPGQHLHLEFRRTEITARAEYLKSQVRRVIRELLVADRGADAVAKTLRQPLTADLD
ncbi:MAG TPA: hypothetical protein VI365_09300, partial [Trebonia sp.]